MITGSYIIEIPRIEKILKKNKFIAKLYSPQEMKFLMEKHFPVFSIAEMFCAKCAFMKAMGISSAGIKMSEISVLTDYSGAYYISLAGKAKKAFAIKKARISISCSHTKNLASAIVIFYE
ncbi:MAG: 4'-phosphopantetheinyl transferase superfamily protein [Oscillospiraceae bacterium]|nr:4'-phosphopantetheinyl transferase superfamily protein [Oscillospiraceae bacterium]